jgi:predicted nuclease with TOPRIM domain
MQDKLQALLDELHAKMPKVRTYGTNLHTAADRAFLARVRDCVPAEHPLHQLLHLCGERWDEDTDRIMELEDEVRDLEGDVEEAKEDTSAEQKRRAVAQERLALLSETLRALRARDAGVGSMPSDAALLEGLPTTIQDLIDHLVTL